MNAPKLLVLIGPHGAGKSTLGRAIAAAIGWRYDDEIGERLRHAALSKDSSAHAQRPQAEFDEAVLRAELERDATSDASEPRVVETWHPGNLAYALARSPAVAAKWEAGARASAQRLAQGSGLLVQPLIADPATLQSRRTEPGPPEIIQFFRTVADSALAICLAWGLPVAPTIETHRLDPHETLKQVLQRLC
jgi:hypothetical protein